MPHGDRAGFGFLAADHEHVGNLLQLRVPDFCRQLLIAVVEVHAQAMALQRFGDVLRVIHHFFADRADFHLYRREPQRKRARVVLDQHAEEALHRTQQRPVHHQRLMLRAVLGNVLQTEARRQIEIELHGRKLPRPADRVDELDVDFRAVKSAFALNRFVRDIEPLQGVGQAGGGAVPVFGLALVIFRMRSVPIGKLDFKFVEAEVFHHRESKIDAGFDFFFDLRWSAENVRVVLREAANAEQAVQDAAAFVAIDGAELGEAHGEIAVAVELRFVDEDVAGAVHGLELVVGFLDFDRPEHAVLVEIGVAAGFPEVEPHDVRGVDEVVAAFEKFIAQPVFDNFADQAALGMPKDQARTGFVLNAEEFELGAELAMIAAFGLFEAMEVFVQLFFCEEAGGVNALELGIALLAFPVGAGDVHEFEGLDALGGRNVWAAAEVDELAGGVEGDDGLYSFFLDELALEDLVGFFVELEGFGLGDELALVGEVLSGELVHLGFDSCEVVGGERFVAEEFVEEAGVDGRTNAEFDVGIQLHDRGGEQMRGGMAEDKKGVGILFGEDLELDVVVEGATQID